ncbi:MAG: Fic family protein [Methanomassiliicoccaceae archaeon]|nr:Fic family protein [Methanomassiliicoccaceae archaeon]
MTEAANKWGLSGRIVRRYCSEGRIDGALMIGKTWNIPENASPPERKKAKRPSENAVLNALREEKDGKIKGRIYHKVQVNMTYNSNRIEGSKLSEDQTRWIFETNTIGIENEAVNIDDIIETKNHFRCIDLVIENAERPLTEGMIKELHFTLKTGTSDSERSWFRTGAYKLIPNEVGGEETCPPAQVGYRMNELIEGYNSKRTKTVEDIIGFHQRFERIHPFQDGNGRVGRLIMFKECLANDIVPFIIDERHRLYYYRGLKEWENEKGFLLDTCLSAQDEFRKWLRYFEIMEQD